MRFTKISPLTVLPPVYQSVFFYSSKNLKKDLSLLLSVHFAAARFMAGSPAAYIHTVQHLIEECLLFHMTKEECVEALSKHANIQPVITSTGVGCDYHKPVWQELEKENKEFFEAYKLHNLGKIRQVEPRLKASSDT